MRPSNAGPNQPETRHKITVSNRIMAMTNWRWAPMALNVPISRMRSRVAMSIELLIITRNPKNDNRNIQMPRIATDNDR